MTKLPLTGQSPFSTFDNKNDRLYFDILIRKTHELDFNVYINVELCLSFKIAQESP